MGCSCKFSLQPIHGSCFCAFLRQTMKGLAYLKRSTSCHLKSVDLAIQAALEALIFFWLGKWGKSAGKDNMI